MSDALKNLVKQVSDLSEDELQEFRSWFLEYDAGRWDEQMVDDVDAGRLDQLAAEALDPTTATANPDAYDSPRLATLLGVLRRPSFTDQGDC